LGRGEIEPGFWESSSRLTTVLYPFIVAFFVVSPKTRVFFYPSSCGGEWLFDEVDEYLKSESIVGHTATGSNLFCSFR